MPRTLDPALASAMNSGSFTPYFKVQLLTNKTDIEFETEEVTGFELDGLTARVHFHDPAYAAGWNCFRILRGVLINGVPIYVTSSCYYPDFDRYEKRIRTLEGHLFPINYFTTDGAQTYKYLCDLMCAEFDLSAVYADPAAAWLNYKFYPTGRQLTMGNVRQFFTILRQKYLIFATDYDDDQVLFFQAHTTSPDYPSGYHSVHPGIASIPGIGSYKQKSFLSRDENLTTHTSGDPDSPIHNLGYLESTASHPARTFYYDTNEWVIKDISPNLKYLDFDPFKVIFNISTWLLWPARVKEIFNNKLHPSWQWQARFLDVFANTEGGQIPSTLEASAPYTPLNTSTFDKNLNSTVNNLQALAERVDELDIGPSINAGVNIDPPDDADLVPVVDVSLATPSLKKLPWSSVRSRILSKALVLQSDGTKTIASGSISVTGEGSRIQVDTEGGAATDSLTGITGGVAGQILLIRTVSSARDVTVVDGGTLFLAGSNFVMGTVDCVLFLMCIGADNWVEISRSTN
jgi:hypothetical protein